MSYLINDIYVLMKLLPEVCDFNSLASRKQITLDIIEEIPALKNFFAITSNPNLTIEFVEKYIDEKWFLEKLLILKIITPKFVEKYPKFQLKYLCGNPNFYEIFLHDATKINFQYLSINPKLTWDVIYRYKTAEWDWFYLSTEMRITEDDLVLISCSPHIIKKLNWHRMSFRKDISWESIETFINLPWSLYNLSSSIDIPWSFIEKYEKKSVFNWFNLSQRKDLTWEYVAAHWEFPWDFRMIGRYSHLVTLDKILLMGALNFDVGKKSIKWDYGNLSINLNIPLGYIKNTMKKHEWNFIGISQREDLTLDFIRKYQDEFPIHYISRNPVITEEIVEACPNIKWEAEGLACNKKISLAFIVKKFGYRSEIFKREDITYKDILQFKEHLRKPEDLKLRQIPLINNRKYAERIQRVWCRYLHRKIKKEVHKELSLLPPTENGGFLGGEEYRKSQRDFQDTVKKSLYDFQNTAKSLDNFTTFSLQN